MRVDVPTIRTDRLSLMPLSLADAAALVNGHVPEGARWVTGYPTDGTLVAAGFVVTAETEGRDLGPWTTYQIVRVGDGVVVGDCGFIGPPDESGDAQVGFGIAFGERNRGYASEALRGLIDWARRHSDARRIVADVHPANFDSIAVMENAGMRRTGRDERLVYYEA